MARTKQTVRRSHPVLPVREEVEAAYKLAKSARITTRTTACTKTYVDHFVGKNCMDKEDAVQCLSELGDTFPLFNKLASVSDDELNTIRFLARREVIACSELRWAANMSDLALRREFLQTLKVTYLSRQRAVWNAVQPEENEWVGRINYLLWCEHHANVLKIMEECAWCPEYEDWANH